LESIHPAVTIWGVTKMRRVTVAALCAILMLFALPGVAQASASSVGIDHAKRFTPFAFVATGDIKCPKGEIFILAVSASQERDQIAIPAVPLTTFGGGISRIGLCSGNTQSWSTLVAQWVGLGWVLGKKAEVCVTAISLWQGRVRTWQKCNDVKIT
jgi:hypothetical protein